MAIVAKAPESSNYDPCPAGVHRAVCTDVWEPWTEERDAEWGGGLVEKTRICWIIDEINPKNGKPFEVSNLYTVSLHEKANLCKALQSWRGREFTPEEKKGFDLEKLLGISCQIQVIHHEGKNGKTYANVQSIMPLGKGQDKLAVPKDYVRKKDRPKDTPPASHGDDGPPPSEGEFQADDSDCPF